MGNERLRVFPIWEMQFTKMPDNVHHIATERVKWSVKIKKNTASKQVKSRMSP